MIKVKGIPVDFSGETYIVPPLNLFGLEQLQDRLSRFQAGSLTPESVSTIVDAAWFALRRNYPEMTRDKVLEMIGMENMQEVLEAVMDVSGLKRKTKEAAAQEGTPGE